MNIELYEKLTFIFFKPTLFVLLIALILDLTKTHILPILREQLRQAKKRTQEFKNKIDLLKKTKQRITKEINKQNKLLTNLEAKIKNWHKQQLKRQSAATTNQTAINQKLTAQKKQQNQANAITTIQKLVIPKAIAAAQKQLKSVYGKEKGQSSLNTLIKQL